MIAADFGNFARVPEQRDIDALKALGVTRVIVGSSFGNVALKQIAACQPHFEVQEFMFPEALRTPLGDWWLDVEISPYHVPTQVEVRHACQRTPIGVYSSKSQWDALWPDWDIVSEFPWLKLWTANYGPLPRPFTPYGGWTAPSMTQYQDTTDIGTGFEVDLSEYTAEEVEMQPFLVWCDEEKAAYIVGPTGAKPVYNRKDYDAFEAAFGKPALTLTSLGVKALQ